MYAKSLKKTAQNTPHPQFLHILKHFLHILKVAGKRRQTKTRFQSAERERLRSTKCKVAGKRRQTKTRFQSAKRERLRSTKMQSRGPENVNVNG